MKAFQKIALLVILASFLTTVRFAYASPGSSINLPPSTITVEIDYPSTECYYYVVLSNVPEGYHVSNGQFLGWCVDEHHCISDGRTYSATFYSSYDPDNPHPDPDWSKVNYILNNKQGSWQDVQAAIWYFVDGGNWPSDPDAQALINTANTHGEGFIPAPGEKIAIIVWINDSTQVPIIEVIVPLQNVVPEYPLGTILGIASFFAALGVYTRKHSTQHF